MFRFLTPTSVILLLALSGVTFASGTSGPGVDLGTVLAYLPSGQILPGSSYPLLDGKRLVFCTQESLSGVSSGMPIRFYAYSNGTGDTSVHTAAYDPENGIRAFKVFTLTGFTLAELLSHKVKGYLRVAFFFNHMHQGSSLNCFATRRI